MAPQGAEAVMTLLEFAVGESGVSGTCWQAVLEVVSRLDELHAAANGGAGIPTPETDARGASNRPIVQSPFAVDHRPDRTGRRRRRLASPACRPRRFRTTPSGRPEPPGTSRGWRTTRGLQNPPPSAHAEEVSRRREEPRGVARRRRRGRRGSRLRRHRPVRFRGDRGVHARARGGGARRARARGRRPCPHVFAAEARRRRPAQLREGQARLEPRLGLRERVPRRGDVARRRRGGGGGGGRPSSRRGEGVIDQLWRAVDQLDLRGGAQTLRRRVESAGRRGQGHRERGRVAVAEALGAALASLSFDDAGARGNGGIFPALGVGGWRAALDVLDAASDVDDGSGGVAIAALRGLGPAVVACIQKIPESPERAVLAVARFAYPRGTNEEKTGAGIVEPAPLAGPSSAEYAELVELACVTLLGRRRRRRRRPRRRRVAARRVAAGESPPADSFDRDRTLGTWRSALRTLAEIAAGDPPNPNPVRGRL